MTTLLAMALVLMSIALVAIMFRDHRRGTCELLSCRNIALVGLILFQLGSCAYSLFTGDNSVFRINNPVWTGFQFVAMAAIFIFLSLWSYRQGWVVTKLTAMPSSVVSAHRRPCRPLPAVCRRATTIVPGPASSRRAVSCVDGVSSTTSTRLNGPHAAASIRSVQSGAVMRSPN